MKKIILILAVIFATGSSFAQAPQSINYQAVVRDGANNVIPTQAVGIQLIIHQGSAGGTAVYTETFSPTTNAFGLVNLAIGTGTTTDDFTTIDWAAGPYFLETAVDITGGTSYASMGTSQLISVPYALHAETVTNADDADADPTNEYTTSVVLNGNNLETTDGGGTIVTDLTPLIAAGGGQWTLNGNNIVNSNTTGNVGIGYGLTAPLYRLTVSDTGFVTMGLGHNGSFNEINSGRLSFNEDVNYNGECGLLFDHNGAENNLWLKGGCSTLDTVARFNRSGYTNIKRLNLGDTYFTNSTLPLTVSGNSAFTGDVTITGNLSVTGNIAKGGGTFKIDHPLDPANKYLVHSFVESPEMMNVYSGNITTDANGFATVTLPDYFEAANKDFRYQLTVIGSFAQAIIKEKVSNNTFVIQTNTPNVEVSWQVTGVRADKYANEHRIVPVVEKELKGTYIHPELYNQDASTQENLVIEKNAQEKQAREELEKAGADN